jgi:predicted signal transduction protein with EAL and GGDEF domain
MLLFRWAILLLLVAAGVCFAFYAATGQQRFRRVGLITLTWTLVAAFGFFAVLIVERLRS